MIKLIHPFFPQPICFDENTILIICIEHPQLFYDFVRELKKQCDGEEGRVILSEDNKKIEIVKCVEIVTDVISLNFNQKSVLTKVQSMLREQAVASEMYLETSRLLSDYSQYMMLLLERIECPLTFEMLDDVSVLLKVANIKLTLQYHSFLEEIVAYMCMMRDFCCKEIFFFVHLKSFLTKRELTELYRMAAYEKVFIILLESTEEIEKIENEKYYIIDKDLCNIY